MLSRSSGISPKAFEDLLVTGWGFKGLDQSLGEQEDTDHAVDILRKHIDWLAADEKVFGSASALKSFGQVFKPQMADPAWLIRGQAKRCYDNATGYATVRDDVFYAEGFAIDLGLPVPIEHAWLVTSCGQVIDPTWSSRDRRYIGVAFNRDSLVQMLEMNVGEAGILSNWHRFTTRRTVSR